MANVTELEKLVVRLAGDSSGYQQMLNDAQKITKDTTSYIERATGKIRGFGAGILDFAKQVTAFVVALKVVDWLKGTTAAFDEQKDVIDRLTEALGTGPTGKEWASTYDDMAVSIQNLTTVSRRSVLEIAALAEEMGLVDAEEEGAIETAATLIRNTVLLQRVLGEEAEDVIELAAAIAEGEVALEDFGEQLVKLHDILGAAEMDEVFAAEIAQELLNEAWMEAQREAKTLEGQLKQLQNEYQDLKATVGGAVEAVKTSFQAALGMLSLQMKRGAAALVEGARAALEGLYSYIASVWERITGTALPTWEEIKKGIDDAMTFGRLAVANFGDVVDYWFNAAKELWSSAGDALSPVWDWVTRVHQAFVDWVIDFAQKYHLVKVPLAVIAGAVIAVRLAILRFQSASDDAVSAATATWEFLGQVVSTVARFFVGIGEGVGRITSPVRAFFSSVAEDAAEVGKAFASTLGDGKQAIEETTEALTRTSEESTSLFRSLNLTGENAILTLVAVASGFSTLFIAFRIASSLLTLIGFKFLFLKAAQMASAIAWGAWAVVVTLAQGVVSLFSLQVALWNAVISTGAGLTLLWAGMVAVAKFAMAAYSLVTGAATAATAAFMAVMSAANLLAFASNLLAIAGTVAILVAGFALIAGVIYGIVESGDALFKMLDTIPTTEGPIADISNMFGEWLGIIKEVVAAVQVDMSLAWRLAGAGMRLAVEQIKALWPPLWEFIREGFLALWDVVVIAFREGFSKGLYATGELYGEMLVKLGERLGPFGKKWRQMGQDIIDDMKEMAKDADDTISREMDTAEARLKKALDTFKKRRAEPGVSFWEWVLGAKDPVEEARKEVDKIRKTIESIRSFEEFIAFPEVEWFKPDMKDWKDFWPEAEEVGKGVGKALKTGFRSERFDAVLYDSAAALSRLAEYKDRLGIEAGKDIRIGGTIIPGAGGFMPPLRRGRRVEVLGEGGERPEEARAGGGFEELTPFELGLSGGGDYGEIDWDEFFGVGGHFGPPFVAPDTSGPPTKPVPRYGAGGTTEEEYRKEIERIRRGGHPLPPSVPPVEAGGEFGPGAALTPFQRSMLELLQKLVETNDLMAKESKIDLKESGFGEGF